MLGNQFNGKGLRTGVKEWECPECKSPEGVRDGARGHVGA